MCCVALERTTDTKGPSEKPMHYIAFPGPWVQLRNKVYLLFATTAGYSCKPIRVFVDLVW